MVILRPLDTNSLQIFFLICSIFLGISWSTTSPSSRYNPALSLQMVASWSSMYTEISSHVSAPSYEPMVTSNRLAGPSFFDHGTSLLNNSY